MRHGGEQIVSVRIVSFFGVSVIRNGTAVSQEGSGLAIKLGPLTAGTTSGFDYDFLTDLSPVPEPTIIAFSTAGASLLVALRSRFRKVIVDSLGRFVLAEVFEMDCQYGK